MILLVTKKPIWECQRESRFSGNKRLTSDLKKKIVDNDSHILSEECPLRSRSPVLFSKGSYLAVVFRRAPLAGLSWSRRREHERVSLASADSARFGLKGEERTDDTPPRDRIFQGARSVVLLFSSNIARSFSSFASSCSSSSSFSSFSSTSVFLRASLVAPKRSSYSFVRPNFYERLPAREFRNCLFSGTPGTSWSRPRRHREIESSGFSLPSFYLHLLLPLCVLPLPLALSLAISRSAFSLYFRYRATSRNTKSDATARTLYLVWHR